jgi:hypothetical protein
VAKPRKGFAERGIVFNPDGQMELGTLDSRGASVLQDSQVLPSQKERYYTKHAAITASCTLPQKKQKDSRSQSCPQSLWCWLS